MKNLILTLFAIVTISFTSFGQAPEGFKYQAVIRDAGNTILNNQSVGIRMTIQQGSIGGATVYQEIFTPTTNEYGLVNLDIGSGTVMSGDFISIDWANGPYFIETAIDLTGGTNYVVMGTSELMSVPYALHANTAQDVINDQVDDADNDPTNEIETWSTLSGIPADIVDGDDVDDADNDPTNEIELPATATEGDVLVYTGGQWQAGPENTGTYQYVENALWPFNSTRNTWLDYPGVSLTVLETGTYHLQFYGFGQNLNTFDSGVSTLKDGPMHLRVQNTTTNQTIADVTATSRYLDMSSGTTVWRFINQYPSGWRVVDLNAGDVIVIQYVQWSDDDFTSTWQMGATGLFIRKLD